MSTENMVGNEIAVTNRYKTKSEDTITKPVVRNKKMHKQRKSEKFTSDFNHLESKLSRENKEVKKSNSTTKGNMIRNDIITDNKVSVQDDSGDTIMPKKCCLTDLFNVSWFKFIDEKLTENSQSESQESGVDKSLIKYAESLYMNEQYLWKKESFNYTMPNNHNRTLLMSMITSGTFIDKIKSMVVLIKNSPVHEMKFLEELIKMCSKKVRRESIVAIDAVKDLFLETLLPSHRRLCNINKRNFRTYMKTNEARKRDVKFQFELRKLLIIAVFEEKLVGLYEAYINSVIVYAKDEIGKVRTKMIGILHDLLSAKPQAEEKLLSEIINKMGDGDKTTASHVVYLIKKLLRKHNKMAINVIDEVRKFLMRPKVPKLSQYYGLTLINQTILSKEDTVLTNSLLALYFSFFDVYSEDKLLNSESLNSKVLNSILTGINRAIPFVDKYSQSLDKYIDKLFKICHVGSFLVCTQSLLLINHVAKFKQAFQDRYYQLLYETIYSCALNQHSSVMTMFVDLLFKSVDSDNNKVRQKAFFKRIFQVCLYCEPPLVGLFIINIGKSFFKLRGHSLVLDGTHNDNDFNDDLENEIKAKLESGLFDDNGDEYFEDIDRKKKKNKKNGQSAISQVKLNDEYDIAKRNPIYSNADKTDYYELQLLQNYCQPTVSHFVKQIINKKQIDYNGDPFNDLTTNKFFDKFTLKTPKKCVKDKDFFTSKKDSLKGRNSVFDESVIEKNEDSLSPEERIFYHYYKSNDLKKKSRKRRRNLASDDSSDDYDATDLLPHNREDFDWNSKFKEKFSGTHVDDNHSSESSNFSVSPKDSDIDDFSDNDSE